MSNIATVARPYAKALFEHAIETGLLSQWTDLLYILTEIVSEEDASHFLTNPNVTAEQKIELLQAPLTGYAENTFLTNLFSLLADNKRLMVLPEIYEQFISLRAQQEKTLQANISSYYELTAKQQQQLSEVLSQRLQRKVTINLSVDKSLLGGAIIQAGDLVIDGSVRGKLNKLSTALIA